jgi:hypothetical protein
MANAKYTPFGNNLNPGVAIIQAANALDVAANFAVASRDTEALVRIAREWVEMSSHLAYDDSEDTDDEPGDEKDSRSFGFSTVSDTNEGEENAECEC